MKLSWLRISNFQSFGPTPTKVTFEGMTFLLGPNGSGKTAVLQALARMFGFDPALRRIRVSDFHVATSSPIPTPGIAAGPAAAVASHPGVAPPAAPVTAIAHTAAAGPAAPEATPTAAAPAAENPRLWIEAQFEFDELALQAGQFATVPPAFAHLQLDAPDGVPRLRFRLTATLDDDGEVDEVMQYVLETDATGEPTKPQMVAKADRNLIQVHYLPARRDPTDHVSYGATSLLGRALRAATWSAERAALETHTAGISAALEGNPAVAGISAELNAIWSGLHLGTFYSSASISFENSEIEAVLRHLTVDFTPTHDTAKVDFRRLSDGQQSLLYIALVLSLQSIGRQVLAGISTAFDPDKLRPAVFTLIATEEPENSLSPQYVGRVVKALSEFAMQVDAQAVVATHAPALLRRVDPKNVRFMRLNESRQSTVRSVIMPASDIEAHKFVREAVQAFPEVYFARLVVLGEGDSEEIVLPRLLEDHTGNLDAMSVVVAPLGGRHVNHFWRLLNGLQIPYVTLLDLDLGRNQGGWGRIKYVADQLLALETPGEEIDAGMIAGIPAWNSDHQPVMTDPIGKQWRQRLETRGVFFSAPLDLDFALMSSFRDEYGVAAAEVEDPDAAILTSVLGKARRALHQYQPEQAQLFGAYHTRFKLASKPVQHLRALAKIDAVMEDVLPAEYKRLCESVRGRLESAPE
jgi:putative ATP-dependent endonuclease of OLD family